MLNHTKEQICAREQWNVMKINLKNMYYEEFYS